MIIVINNHLTGVTLLLKWHFHLEVCVGINDEVMMKLLMNFNEVTVSHKIFSCSINVQYHSDTNNFIMCLQKYPETDWVKKRDPMVDWT